MNNHEIDWKTIYQHLAQTKNLIDRRATYSNDEINVILKERATYLAKPIVEKNENETRIRVVNFMLDSEVYGIESDFVDKVCEAAQIFPIPCVPAFVEGIINIHGSIVCVINLKVLFGLNKSKNNNASVIITHHEDVELGIIVDSINGIDLVDIDNLQPPLPTITGIHSDYLKGLTENQKIILNIPKLLASKEIIINQTV